MIEKVSRVPPLTHLLPFQKQWPWPYPFGLVSWTNQENIVAREVMILMYDAIWVKVGKDQDYIMANIHLNVVGK